ncbi:MAG: hypothetical protein K6F53_08515 [Lachnospiraceae bacterium]|nr:hypothetical protein [Lachnospiraceae bacterium]
MRGDSSRAVTPKDTGTYYARIEGKKNYTGHVIKSFKILGEGEKIRIPVSKLTIGKIGSVKYDGTKKMPELTVSYGKKKLTKDVDYKLEYGDNIEAGTGTVIIEGLEDYTGSRTVTFKITGSKREKEFQRNRCDGGL